MKHTAGPWQAMSISTFGLDKLPKKGKYGPSYARVVDADGVPIDIACWGDGESDAPYFLYFSPDNARLIAAAPELLEALKLCAGLIRGNFFSGAEERRILAIADKVLAKAEGYDEQIS